MVLTPSRLEQAQELCQAGRYSEAQKALEGYCPTPSEQGPFQRMLGWLAVQRGETERGVKTLEQAVKLETGLERAKTLVTLGAALERIGELESALVSQREALALFGGHASLEVQTLCNLGSLELRRLKLESAQHYFDSALTLTRSRKETTVLRPRALLGLSGLARVSGYFERALYRASQALGLTLSIEERLLALRLKAGAERGLGQYELAQDTLHCGLALEPQGLSRATLSAHLGYAEVQGGLLERARGRLHGLEHELPPSQRSTWWLFQAELSRCLGAEDSQIHAALEQALKLEDAFSLHDEARGLSPLFAWGRARGLALTHVPASLHPTVRLETLGATGIYFEGRALPLKGSRRTLALLSFLTLEGPAHWERVADAILEPSNTVTQYRTLNRTVGFVRDLLGSREVLTLEAGVLTLHAGWTWACDAQGTTRRGNFLPGLHTEWAESIRETARLSSSL